jgi:hypothetical protein
MENNLEYILKLWDYDLNNVSPQEVNYCTSKKYYFKCNCGKHPSELSCISNITGEKHYIPNCRMCNSFGQWCIDNNQQTLLDRWDNELNNISPFNISKMSGKKFYFKCDKNKMHPSELKMISNIVKQPNSRLCLACNSIGQWGIDNIDPNFIDKYWSNKNKDSALAVNKRSGKKMYFKCQNTDYHGDYEATCANFTAGKRCPFCINHKIHIKDSLGTLNKKSFDLWSCNNELTPYDYAPLSNKVILITCKKHGELSVNISVWNEKYDCKCPECIKETEISYLERQVRDYLKDKNIKVLHEEHCRISPINPKTGHNLLYDNELVDYNLIIEVHGAQHYMITHLTKLSAIETNSTPEEVLKYQQWKDFYKKEYAISRGYSYLEIPYTAFNKTENDYRKYIDRELNKLTLTFQP